MGVAEAKGTAVLATAARQRAPVLPPLTQCCVLRAWVCCPGHAHVCIHECHAVSTCRLHGVQHRVLSLQTKAGRVEKAPPPAAHALLWLSSGPRASACNPHLTATALAASFLCGTSSTHRLTVCIPDATPLSPHLPFVLREGPHQALLHQQLVQSNTPDTAWHSMAQHNQHLAAWPFISACIAADWISTTFCLQHRDPTRLQCR